MDSSSSAAGQHAIAIESLFRDAYRILGEIQEAPEWIESLSSSIGHCQKEIRILERIHSNQSRVFRRDASQDTFNLRGPLDKFMATCNALTYIVSPFDSLDKDYGKSCIAPSMFPSMFTSKPSRKRKAPLHIQSLENDFASHERTLSMVLAHAVYTTTLEIQRLNEIHDPSLSTILRRSERRHAAFERFDPDNRDITPQKQVESKADESDWELCLQRYFQYVDSWTYPDPVVEETGPSLSRRSSFVQPALGQPLQRRLTNESLNTPYGDFQESGNVDPNRYYRKPRPRSTSAHSVRQPLPDPAGNRWSTQSVVPVSSNALVLYGSADQLSTNPSSAVVRRRNSITGDFPWECLANTSTAGLIAPLTERWPDLKQAHSDICIETQGMTASEARAYAQGRLASFGPEVGIEIKAALGSGQQANASWTMANQRRNSIHRDSRGPTNLHATSAHTTPVHTIPVHAAPVQSKSWSKPRSIMARPHSMSPTQKPMPRTQTLPSKPPPKGSPTLSKNRFFSLQDLRPLTAISERSRPGTSQSKASSMNKSSSRSIMQAFKTKKSNLSKEILDVIPDRESQSKGSNSTGSVTLTSVKDLEIVKYDKNVSKKRSSRSTASKSSLNLDKPLPPNPPKTMDSKTPRPQPPKKNTAPPVPQLTKNKKPAQSSSIKAAHMLKMLKPPMPGKKDRSRISLTSSVVSLQSQLSANRSRESLSVRRVSVDLLRRKDSKMTLISVTEGLEMPFDTWLRALPYIEGRTGSSRH